MRTILAATLVAVPLISRPAYAEQDGNHNPQLLMSLWENGTVPI
jgi:hypothetical protein